MGIKTFKRTNITFPSRGAGISCALRCFAWFQARMGFLAPDIQQRTRGKHRQRNEPERGIKRAGQIGRQPQFGAAQIITANFIACLPNSIFHSRCICGTCDGNATVRTCDYHLRLR